MKSSRVMIDFLFPPRCAICGRVLEMGTGHICDKCRPLLSELKEPRCYKCGKELALEEKEYCLDCTRHERLYVKGFPVFKYIPPLQESLTAFKFHGRQENALFFGDAINEVYGKTFKELGIEALIPVPIHRSKYKTRGYNQATLIADRLGELTGIKVLDDLLIRSTNTDPQKDLGYQQRELNLRGAFSANKKVIDATKLPEVAIIVDDIYTTGATVQACTKVCMEIGIKKVYYTSVAIGMGQ